MTEELAHEQCWSKGLVWVGFMRDKAAHSSKAGLICRCLSPPPTKSMGVEWQGPWMPRVKEFYSIASEQVRRPVWFGGVQFLLGAIAGISEVSRSRERVCHSQVQILTITCSLCDDFGKTTTPKKKKQQQKNNNFMVSVWWDCSCLVLYVITKFVK